MYNRIQLGLVMSVSGMLVSVCVIVSSTCSDCDPVLSLAVYDGHIPA